MLVAHHLASSCLPKYSSRFSRHDFTLPQLFACLVVKEQQNWRRVPYRRFTAVFDAGYDAEHNHEIARRDMGIRSIIPPLIGRPTDRPPTYWRRHMKRLLATQRSRRRCGYTQRWQAETMMSMIKRNLGSALRGRSRYRDLTLKVLTHDVMIIRRQQRVETQQYVVFPSA